MRETDLGTFDADRVLRCWILVRSRLAAPASNGGWMDAPSHERGDPPPMLRMPSVRPPDYWEDVLLLVRGLSARAADVLHLRFVGSAGTQFVEQEMLSLETGRRIPLGERQATALTDAQIARELGIGLREVRAIIRQAYELVAERLAEWKARADVRGLRRHAAASAAVRAAEAWSRMKAGSGGDAPSMDDFLSAMADYRKARDEREGEGGR